MNDVKRIAIIGAGLSGTLLTINLLRRDSSDRVEIYWIDRNKESDMGFAYSTSEDYLLNVSAGLMSAFSGDPDSFLEWSRATDPDIESGAYLPRKLYRKYIKELLEQAEKGKKENIRIRRFRDLVTDLKVKGNQVQVHLEEHGIIETDQVVLATGNPLPGNPVLGNMGYIRDGRYAQNPWDFKILDRITESDTVAFIGTGQTMVDLVTGLYKRKHKGKLIAISRRGILPMSQKMSDPYPSFFSELKDLKTILSVFQVVRKHLEIAQRNNLDPRSVIDSLRPHSTAIWMNFPLEEKKRFLRHLFRYWEVIRSRIPPASESIINELIGSGQLTILSGRITGIIPSDNTLEVNFNSLNSNAGKSFMANYLINCKGPDLDYEKTDQPLIKNLLSSKLITCDPVHLGINALPEGPVITNGSHSEVIFTIGPPLKGIVWESIAAPEIRVQAEGLSRLLIN